MEAELVAKLIVEIGFPAAEQLIQWIEQKKTLGAAEFAHLRSLGAVSAADYLEAAGGAPKTT